MRAPVRTLMAAAVVVAGVAFLPGGAGAASLSGPPVPLNQWVATFCRTFATYETDALAAQTELEAAITGPTSSTGGEGTTADVARALRKAGRSAQAAAAAVTADGVPDVPHPKVLIRELQSVLRKAARTYTREAERAASMPVRPKALTKAAEKIGSDLGQGLDAQGKDAKRLRKLDGSNALGGAISADPTCAAAARDGGRTP